MKATKPFANGTEFEAWYHVWCESCAHDHWCHSLCDDESVPMADRPVCDLMVGALVGEDDPGGEAWIAEPDDGKFALPSRMICLRYTPCTRTDYGNCTGDPAPDTRAAIRSEVEGYWRERLAR